MVEIRRVDCEPPRLGGHIVGKHRVEMDVSQMAINQGGLDDVHESAENVPRVFLVLMDVGIEHRRCRLFRFGSGRERMDS